MKRPRARAKIVDLETLCRRVAAARRRGERIVFTNGCFDLLHVGHLRSLEEARAQGDRLIVAVNGDASVRRLKGPGRPVRRAADRMELLAGLACVDWVVRFDSATPIRLIERLAPDVLAKGGDWRMGSIVGAEFVLARGGRVVRLRVVPGRRTSEELARLRAKPARVRRSARPRARSGESPLRPARGGIRNRAARRSDR